MIYLQSITALAMVLGLIGLFYYIAQRLMNRTGGGISKRRIKVIERVPVGEKRVLMLVQVGQQQLLLGATNNSISMLSLIDHEELAEDLPKAEKSEEELIPRISFRRLMESFR